MKVIIAGGGIGGLAAALFLHERAPKDWRRDSTREARVYRGPISPDHLGQQNCRQRL